MAISKIKFSLRTKLALAISIAMFTLTILGVSLGYYWGGNLLRDTVADEHAKLARALAFNVELLLNNEIDKLVVVSSDSLWKRFLQEQNEKHDSRSSEDTLLNNQKNDKKWLDLKSNDPFIQSIINNVVGVELADILESSKGNISEFLVTDFNGALIAATTKVNHFYYGDKHWWQETYRHGEGAIHIDNFEFDETRSIVTLSLSCPIRNEDGFILGISRMIIPASVFNEKLTKYRVGETGYTTIIDRDGKSIFDPTKNKQLLTGSTVQSLLSKPNKWTTIIDPSTQKGAFVSIAPVDTPYVTAEPTRWFILIKQDLNEIMAPLHKLILQMLIVLLLILLLIIPIVLWVSKKFLAPLHQLHANAQNIHQGALDTVIDIRTGDEIEELANTLKALVSNLKEKQQELQSALEKAVQANQLKSQFLSNVSHEMRTPLHCIMNYLEDIHHMTSPEKVQGQAELALREAERLLLLINDLLDNAKIDAGRIDLIYAPMDLYQLLRDIKNSMKFQTDAKNIELQLNVDDNVPQFIISDALRLRQIIINLISNAIKFTNHGCVTIDVRVQRQEPESVVIRFAVIDSGIGIPPDKVKNLFQSFSQVDGSLTRKYSGFGLGTRIVKAFVKGMGGELGVDSAVGKGSTFWFIIPAEISKASDLKRHHDPEESIKPEQNTAVYGKKILFADDYLPSQHIMEAHFKKFQLNAKIVTNGREAVEACEKEKFEIIFLDIQMPEMDGLQAAQLIRTGKSECRDVPIIAVTASADFETRQLCEKAGMNDVLTKPFRSNEILRLVELYLDPLAVDAFQQKQKLAPSATIKPKTFMAISEDPINYQQVLLDFAGNRAVMQSELSELLLALNTQVKLIKEHLKHNDLTAARHAAILIHQTAQKYTAQAVFSAAKTLELESDNLDQAQEHLARLEIELLRLERYIKS